MGRRIWGEPEDLPFLKQRNITFGRKVIRMKRLYSIFVFIAFTCPAFGQDTTLLPTVILSVKTLDLTDIGNKHQKIDSATLQSFKGQSMANVLQQETPVFIKSYGVSSLQSISFKGTSASHTNVVWNGIPLNNLNNGITDFGLIPIFDNSEIALISGASGTRFGSSSVGGTVVIQSFTESTKNEIGLLQGFGSYGLALYQFSISQKVNKWRIASNFTWNQAANDFDFKNTRRLAFPTQILDNASYSNWKQCNSIGYSINPNNAIELNTWTFKSERELPGGMASMPNFAIQDDAGTKVSLQWNFKSDRRNLKLNTNAFYSDDRLTYTDKKINLISQAATKLIGLSQTFDKIIGKKKPYYFNTSLHHQVQKLIGQSDAFGQKEEYLYASYGSISANLLPLGLKFQTRLRSEIRSTTKVPLIPAFGLEWQTKWFKFYTNMGKHFRVPTFNDKYWTPGGNENLLPESGMNLDFGLSQSLFNKHLFVELNTYKLSVNNWIQWTPSNQGYWSPENLRTVNSKGVDITTRFSKVIFNSIYSSLLIVESHTSLNQAIDAKTEKQLIYTPQFQQKLSAEIRLPKDFGLRWMSNFTGIRHTTTDHSRPIPGQQIHSLFISWQNDDKHDLSLSLNCNNVFSTQLIGVEGQVQMPRQFLLKIQFKLNTKNNEKH
ncbi:MAG: vitamin B12 transporter [Flavobacteriales bacterium]|jgi:vitamin B12 transporter